jgi:beta-N-acetylhexosaminidase
MSKQTPPSLPDNQKFVLTEFERAIAQRMMLSIRFFESSVEEQSEFPDSSSAVIRLPEPLAHLITHSDLGGVVLFSENIESPQQVVELTSQLQTAAKLSNSQRTLIIGIDQEGGRVTRLKRSFSAGFSGNMAIGATQKKHTTYFADAVGQAIGSELKALGINLNFSPVVDVNSNPDNPVINTRSFGQEPEKVAELGIAMLNGLQQQRVMATLKHFPGHGNTAVDSHTGLPKVEGTYQQLSQVDLYPFKRAIEQSDPAMIMTAHIQYPGLDSSILPSKLGNSIVKPATLSGRILTKLLREKMRFKGVIITDAMNMASITQHFTAVEASAQALVAGADIVLMPFTVRNEIDIDCFFQFIRETASRFEQLAGVQTAVYPSITRIEKLLETYCQEKADDRMRTQHNAGDMEYRKIESALAFESLSLVKDKAHVLPINPIDITTLQIVVRNKLEQRLVQRCLIEYFEQTQQTLIPLKFSYLEDVTDGNEIAIVNNTNSLLIFYAENKHSAVVDGEVETPIVSKNNQKSESRQLREAVISQVNRETNTLHEKQRNREMDVLRSLCVRASDLELDSILISMQSPFEVTPLLSLCHVVLLAYDPAVFETYPDGPLDSFTYQSVISGLFGGHKIKGIAPVQLMELADKL